MNSDHSAAHRPYWAGIAHSGQRTFEEIWDAAWGLLLLSLAGVAQVLRSESKWISYAVLFLLVAGTAAFTRDFSKLAIGPVYITELCMALLAVTLGTLLLRKQISLFPAGRTARWIVYFVLGYLVFGTLRLAWDFVSGASAGLLDVLRNFALIYYAAFAVIGWLVLQPCEARARIRYMLAAVVIVSTLTNLWTAIAYAMDFRSVTGEVDFDPTAVIQGQAAVFAMFAVLIVANMLRYGAMPRNLLLRGAVAVVLVLNVVYIYLSGHRSALVGCAVGLVMLVAGSKTKLHHRVRWRWVAVAVAAVGGLWFFLAAYLVDFAAKFQTLLAPLRETNAAWRAAYRFAVVLLWLTKPVIGVGFAHDFYDEDPLRMVQGQLHYDPHNSYLAILARTGIIGLLLAGLASLLLVHLLVKLVRHSRSGQTVALAGCLLSCFAAIATFAAANVTLESPYHALFFWLFVGFGIALAESDTSVQAT